MSPIDIIAEIEDTLQVECAPLTWPNGMANDSRALTIFIKRIESLYTRSGTAPCRVAKDP